MDNPTWIEMAILALGIAASAFAFWRRFGTVVALIQSAKKDQNFSLGDIASRARTFLWEVLFQAKVIRQRPIPGLAHALVFWGFCAFSLVTLNHFALGFGISLISPAGLFGVE